MVSKLGGQCCYNMLAGQAYYTQQCSDHWQRTSEAPWKYLATVLFHACLKKAERLMLFYVFSLVHVHDDPCQSIPYRKHCILYPIAIFDFIETLGTLLVTSENWARFGILMLLTMKRTIFWDVVPCSLIEIYCHCRGGTAPCSGSSSLSPFTPCGA